MIKGWSLILFLLVVVAVAPIASADISISNSKDWRDVYSVIVYGNINDQGTRFLVSEKHGSLLLNSIEQTETLNVYTSDDQPYVIGYKSIIESAGFESFTEEKLSDFNLDLAEKLEGVDDFVIIDDAYGYNAIAVAPYAVLTKSYVIFANADNIDDVVDYLDSVSVDDLLIYGHADREVRDELDKFNPEIINEDGDRFANNVEIVKKYREINPKRQVVLTNGEFMEAEIMSGLEPVLFIGRENVPEKIKEYIQSTDIEVGVLIGNELVGTATVVRRQVGISTFVKFAQGSRSAAGSIAQVEGLDMFPVPRVSLDLDIVSVKYNKLTGMMEITFKNNAEIATYLQGTYTLTVAGEEFVFGDEEAVFIGKGDTKTFAFKVDDVNPDGELTLKAYVVYGESKNALEFVIDDTFTVSVIEVADSAQLAITKVQYDKVMKQFLITLENVGETSVYADTEIVDILIVGEKTTLSSEDVVLLSAGESTQSKIDAELSDSDLADNPLVHIRAHYGEREDALIKILEGDFEISLKSFNVWTYLPAALILLLILLIFLGRKKCTSCGHKNPRGRKQCKKCGNKLK